MVSLTSPPGTARLKAWFWLGERHANDGSVSLQATRIRFLAHRLMRHFLSLVLGLLLLIVGVAVMAWVVQPGPVTTTLSVADDIEPNVALDRVTFECRYATEERWAAAAREVQARIEAATACSSDADCTLESFGCPFKCLSAVRLDDVAELQDVVADFRADSCIQCANTCRAIAPGTRARCVEHRCVVDAAEWQFVVPFEDLYVPTVAPTSESFE
ncbi:hypothetical protein [Halomonas denitrificans]|nr:hypothetical protein [Halomonas denitrificans]